MIGLPRASLSGRIALTALLALFSTGVSAAPRLETLRVDLPRLIDEAARHPDRFAVDIAHAVDLESAGEWEVTADTATWRYQVRIPTAISMSFHATHIILPPAATLTVRAASAASVYLSADLHRDTLWSRIAKGDSLEFELIVPSSDRAGTVLEIASFQAGYRGLGGGVKDHPAYARLKIQSETAADNSSCVQNYACATTPDNTGPGHAAIALVVANIAQCSGTLLNDVPGDNAPYILTARHCQGPDGASSAADTDVYWNRLTACGTPLGSIYDTGTAIQHGLSTTVEQEDLWLLLLDQSPIVTDAYFAGFDATGGAVQGGYSIHDALSRNKQLVNWFGQAFSSIILPPALGVPYTSHFWDMVNERGNIGPGASGSALFDQNNRVVGALSLGTSTDASGYGACPSSNPEVPDGHNGVARYTRFAAAWNSTADTTSTTGATTLKSVLDPGDTGTLIVNGLAGLPGVAFRASAPGAEIATSIVLSWDATGANDCVASGGPPGDGWSGSLVATGTRSVSEQSEGAISYSIACTFPGGRVMKARTTVLWFPPAPTAVVSPDRAQVWVSRPITLTWSSNRSPCAISGGTVSLQNLPGTGSTTVTEMNPGEVRYQLACGAGREAQSNVLVTFVTPAVNLTANSRDRLLGSLLHLRWNSGADTCTPTGGVPQDGWAGQQRSPNSEFFLQTSVAGSFTYTLTCTSGSLSAEEQLTINVSDIPSATLSTSRTEGTIADTFTVTWRSNLDLCDLTEGSSLAFPDPRTGSNIDGFGTSRFSAGAHELRLHCKDGVNSVTADAVPVTITVIQAQITISPSNVAYRGLFDLVWDSSGATACTASGGGADGGQWTGPLEFSGNRRLTATTSGTFTYRITCTAAQGTTMQSEAKVFVSVPPPSGGGDDGGAGGGGAFDYLSLLALATCLARAVSAGYEHLKSSAPVGRQNWPQVPLARQ
jgi:hypothetical protein